ncbi:hypothetical protein DFQ14_101308 [Halopolyspora algeriensis]|uniref:Uncharacterized protein n=1 Tax=Halopolyspora algeriensis TaxID=1500506 RepID=A0A368VXN5_9ACTN|nr:hypothetical protein DFQ14_101308 [Halopolyspora algeriensis]
MRSRPTVGHSDASRVDHESSVREANEGHVCVAANHGSNVRIKILEDLRPSTEPGVDQHKLFVVTGGRVTEQHFPHPRYRQGPRQRQPSKKVEVILS